MERIFGKKVTDAQVSMQDRAELASTMVSALVGLPFWSSAQCALFHADLHAGNLFVTDDGRLAVLDWSLTLRLSKADRETLVSMILGGLTLDAGRIRHAVAALSGMAADNPKLVRAVEQALDGVVCEGRFPGFDWLLEFLDRLALETTTGFREDFVLCRKTWFSLSGVVEDVAGKRSVDVPLMEAGIRRFVEELPLRLFASPEVRNFSTHLSNSEIVNACSSAWLAPMRYWSRYWMRGWLSPATA